MRKLIILPVILLTCLNLFSFDSPDVLWAKKHAINRFMMLTYAGNDKVYVVTDSALTIYDGRTGTELERIVSTKYNYVDYLPYTGQLILLNRDGTIDFLNLETNTIEKTYDYLLKKHEPNISFIDPGISEYTFSKNSDKLCVLSSIILDQKEVSLLTVWDTSKDSVIFEVAYEKPKRPRLSPDGTLLAFLHGDYLDAYHYIKVYNMTDRSIVYAKQTKDQEVYSMDFSSQYFVTSNFEKRTLKLYNYEFEEIFTKSFDEEEEIGLSNISLSNNEDIIAGTGRYSNIKMTNLLSFPNFNLLKRYDKISIRRSFSPDDSILMINTSDTLFALRSDLSNVNDPDQNIIGIKVIPNPTNDEAIVDFYLVKENTYELMIVDITGKEVLAIPARQYISGKNSILLNTSNLTPGSYTLNFINDNTNFNYQFVVVR